MFCTKCGSQNDDTALFCLKCGEGLTKGAPVIETQEKKKKSKKLLIGLGMIFGLFLIVVIIAANSGEQAKRDEEYIASQQQPSASPANTQSRTESHGSVSLSQIYTNEVEGFSFKHPSGWKVVTDSKLREVYDESELENVVVLLANEEDDLELSSYIEIFKFSSNKAEIDKIFSSTESDFEKAFIGDASIALLSDITLDGVPAKMLIYTMDGEYFRRFYYAIGSTMYKIDCLCATSQAESLEL